MAWNASGPKTIDCSVDVGRTSRSISESKWTQMYWFKKRNRRYLKVLSFIFPEVSLLELYWSPKIMRWWSIRSNTAILVLNKLHIVGYPFKPVDNGAFFVPSSRDRYSSNCLRLAQTQFKWQNICTAQKMQLKFWPSLYILVG